jgi:hypothetical protein
MRKQPRGNGSEILVEIASSHVIATGRMRGGFGSFRVVNISLLQKERFLKRA